MNAEAIYRTLQQLVDTVPDLGGVNRLPDNESYLWLGRVSQSLRALGMTADAMQFDVASQNLGSIALHLSNRATILAVLFRALAAAEARAPVAARGAFIPIAKPMDALLAIAKVIEAAKVSVLFIDPYLDRRVLSDFASQAPEGIEIRLLADSGYLKAGLAPAVAAWQRQYAAVRPLAAKLTAARALHDRAIIVDESDTWEVTQSFEHLADRSPASVTQMPPEVTALKLSFYLDLWRQARPI